MRKYFSTIVMIAAMAFAVACTKDDPKSKGEEGEPEKKEEVKTTLTVVTTSVDLAKEAGSSAAATVNTNATSLSFDFGAADSWLNASFDGKNTVTVSALTANEDTEVRTATITVTAAEGVSGTISVTQAATEKEPEPVVVVSRIGDKYENGDVKGVIFWVDPANPKSAKIVSLVANGPMNFCSNVAVGETTLNAISISGTSESDGAANMTAIESFISTNSVAAAEMLAYSICKAEGEGWYVPSKNELADLVLGYTNGLTFEMIEANRAVAGDKPSEWESKLSGTDAALAATYKAAYEARVKMDKSLAELGGSPINAVEESGSKIADGTTYLSSSQDSDAAKVGYVCSGGRIRTSAAAKFAKSPSRFIRCIKAVTLE